MPANEPATDSLDAAMPEHVKVPSDTATTDSAPPDDDQPLPWKLIGFVCLQIVLLAAGGVWAGYRVRQDHAQYELPGFQPEPDRVGPLHDLPELVSDAELSRLLWKLRPRLRRNESQTNHIDHALRFWGVEAKFDDENCLSGEEMRQRLLDMRQFRQAWNDETDPLMVRVAGSGVRARVAEGAASASHVDHTLATLAEIGTPLDYPIVFERGEGNVGQLLRQAARDFSLNQIEYEWSTLAFALYRPSRDEWFTTEKQRISFDRLARRIMRQDLPQGVCYGNHRLYTLVALLRLDATRPLLSQTVRGEITAFLKDTTARLVANQKSDGSWDREWAGPLPPGASSSTVGTPLGNRILATGHALEWWAIAPDELHPPRETLLKAGRWLVTTIDRLSVREIDANYTFLTHAGRSLAFWRKQWPAAVALTPVNEPSSTIDAAAEVTVPPDEPDATEKPAAPVRP
jgi:hypothetical protein